MQDSAADGPEGAGDRLRVLIPSPLGVIGLEFEDGVVGGVEIVPVGKRRQQFRAFVDLSVSDRSDELDETIGRLSEYFAGARRKLDIEYDIALTGVDEFGTRVLEETARAPYGRTRTYQQIAAAIGRPGAYRQVLSALVANPLPILIPCHRVVPNRAGIGSYVAATAKKEWLLKMERRSLAEG